MENGHIISKDLAVAEIFNNYFANFINSLEIPQSDNIMLDIEGLSDPIDKAVHTSFLSILL